ncbi:MAG: hypothetical protein MPW14_03995 [Candidatus Manganitrophus sp.]|nr:MAG: hypothetical protein MPW14_03995 [Candidatus Manganitrophus sp.]
MPNRMRFETQQLYFKSPEEMIRGFQEVPTAISNTLRIAEMINLDLQFGTFHLPHYEVPAGTSREAYIAALAQQGLERRFAQMRPDRQKLRPLYDERLARELGVINKMGFAGYFLIVTDFIRWARENGDIPVGPGRGSGAGLAGGLCARHHRSRPHRLRPAVRALPQPRAGVDAGFRHRLLHGQPRPGDRLRGGALRARGDVARSSPSAPWRPRRWCATSAACWGKPYGVVDKLAKLIPNDLGITLDKALAQEPRLQQATFRGRPEEDGEVIDLAVQLEGLARNAGKHAGGVVIAPERAHRLHVPLYCDGAGRARSPSSTRTTSRRSAWSSSTSSACAP